MKDFTAKQSIRDSRGEVSATNIYYIFHSVKMAKPSRPQRTAGKTIWST